MLDHCPIIAKMCTLSFSTVSVTYLPAFVPNEHLFSQRPDTPKWEVFADAVREAMCEVSTLKPCNATFAETREYMAKIQGKQDFAWHTSFKQD